MESGLEGRNNSTTSSSSKRSSTTGLNGVRPRRPEQFKSIGAQLARLKGVSMESGLEGRNNVSVLGEPYSLSFSSQWSPA